MNLAPTPVDRTTLAEKIRGSRLSIAQQVTDEFLARHPDWKNRYGNRGQRMGVDDACFHIDFLAGAIDTGSREAFADYARWVVRVLGARGIHPRFVSENLQQVGLALMPVLEPAEHSLVADLILTGCAAVAEGVKGDSSVPSLAPLSLKRTFLVQALILGQRQDCWNIIHDAREQGTPLLEIYVQLLQYAMYEVGRLWETNQITVAQEHMATAIVQWIMTLLYSQLPISSSKQGNALITGVEGELHQLGGHMVADFMEQKGWNVRFLGTNVPPEGVVQALRDHEVDVLGISATMLYSVPAMRGLISMAREKSNRPGLRILVGGGAFRTARSLWKELGADGYAQDLQTLGPLLSR